MIGALLGDFLPYIIAAAAALAGVVGAYFKGRGDGKNKTKVEYHEDKQRRESAGRDRLREGRNSGLSPDDRLRRNDQRW
ncbi:hypothetical protein PVV74_17425 [Roseovarius sp. SK2]|uniref:hypothetical protein n=1 Tax=Roseovarius TaxID=74030 RepID=UPI00237B2419|nr:hypothetical protein [Roseovarius sp. SK2]MDD9727244.1 hypothetical protein [Roseovarius sp. SK2]